jgi:hypothetical protein
MNKQSKRPTPLKKLSLADLQKVVGGEPHIKAQAENAGGTSKSAEVES